MEIKYRSNIDEAKDLKIKHENLTTFEQIYRLAVQVNEPMEKRIKYAILINEARIELKLEKLDFKKEVKYLKKRVNLLARIGRDGKIIKSSLIK